jgi:hypothetical protein
VVLKNRLNQHRLNELIDGRGGGIRRLASVVRHISEFTAVPAQLAETSYFPEVSGFPCCLWILPWGTNFHKKRYPWYPQFFALGSLCGPQFSVRDRVWLQRILYYLVVAHRQLYVSVRVADYPSKWITGWRQPSGLKPWHN